MVNAVILCLCLAPMAWAQGDRSRVQDSIQSFVDRLVRTKSSQERSALLAATKELVTPELRRELVTRGNNFLLAGRYAAALDVYTFAENVAGQINDKEGLASTSLNIGSVHYFQGNFDLALQHYQLARILFTSLGNQTEAARALYGLGLIHKERHDNAEALKTFEQALNEFTALKDDEEVANTLASIGAVYYEQGDYAAASRAFLRSSELDPGFDNVLRIADAFYMQGDYEKAEEYYQKSLQGFAEEKNEAGIVGALEGAANSFYYQGNYDAALEYYQRNVVAQEALGSNAGVATSLQGIGNVYRGRGDFGSALENYLKSVTIAEQAAIKAPTATTLGSIGLVRSLQGDNPQAREYYAKSLEQFEAAGDNVGMTRMLAQLGNAYFAEGSYDAALEAYRKSFVLRVAMNDKTGQANLLTGFGTVYLSQNNYPLALENYQKALAIFESLGNKEASAETLTKIAEAYLLAGDFAQTVDLAERAAALAKEIESHNTFWYARLLSGKAHRALNQPDQAGLAFAQAIATLEFLRSQSASGEPRGRSSLLPYLAEVDLLIEQNKGAEAFDFAERAKLQALSEALGRNRLKINGSMSPSEQAEERKLTSSLVALDLQLEHATQARTVDRLRPATLQDERRKTRLAYADFLNRMYALHPRLKVDRGELSPLRLEDARELTKDPQSALLEYSVTETNVYLFLLTRGQNSKTNSGAGKLRTKSAESDIVLKVYPLNVKGSELVGRVAQFQQLLASRDEAFRQPARDLYDLLIKPAEAELGNKTRLVIVPDGILWRVPFEALQPAEDRFLIDRMSLSYAPSLSALRELRKPRERIARPATAGVKSPQPRTRILTQAVAAFGNPLLTNDLVRRLQVTYNGETVGPAPEREIEIEKLKAAYGDLQSRLYSGANAGEGQAKLEATRSNVLHFAVRAILDDMSPMYASIALAPGESNQPEDGLLQSWEIINLQSQAKLVVLSGSSTKRERAGEAVIALQWSWFVAGTPSMLWSRWEVQSPAVTQLMTELHARLRSQSKLKPSYSKAEALRQSALTLRRSPAYSHPYFWSGFALMGDGG